MQFKVGELVTEDFTVCDSCNNLITGLTQSDFDIKLYLPNNSEDSTSVIITELGNGNYRATFTPSIKGVWYLIVFNSDYFPWGKSNNILVRDTEIDDIDNKIDIIDNNVDQVLIDVNNIDTTSIINTLNVIDNKIDIIDNNVDQVLIDVNNIDNKIDNIALNLTRALGLMQENFFIDNTTYDSPHNLIGSRIRIYSDSISVGTDLNVIATYIMTANYSSNNELIDYKVTKL